MEFDEVGKSQWGLLTWSQLLAFQGEKATLADIDDGRLIRILRSVYRIAGVPETWRQLPMAAFLATGDGCAAACLCAGRLLGIPFVPGRQVQLLVPSERRVRLPGVTPIRSNYLPLHHIEYLDALAVTSVERTICDLSKKLSTETVKRILRGAVRYDLTSYEAVLKRREELRARGRRRTTVIDEIYENLQFTETGESEGEYTLLDWISKEGLPMPASQHWVVTAGGRYCLDGAYVDEKIDLEWDSILHEKTPEDVEYDAARDIELQLAGWLVMRESKLTKRWDFIRRLTTALEQRRPR